MQVPGSRRCGKVTAEVLRIVDRQMAEDDENNGYPASMIAGGEGS